MSEGAALFQPTFLIGMCCADVLSEGAFGFSNLRFELVYVVRMFLSEGGYAFSNLRF
jgi:hypothetical protein